MRSLRRRLRDLRVLGEDGQPDSTSRSCRWSQRSCSTFATVRSSGSSTTSITGTRLASSTSAWRQTTLR